MKEMDRANNTPSTGLRSQKRAFDRICKDHKNGKQRFPDTGR